MRCTMQIEWCSGRSVGWQCRALSSQRARGGARGQARASGGRIKAGRVSRSRCSPHRTHTMADPVVTERIRHEVEGKLGRWKAWCKQHGTTRFSGSYKLVDGAAPVQFKYNTFGELRRALRAVKVRIACEEERLSECMMCFLASFARSSFFTSCFLTPASGSDHGLQQGRKFRVGHRLERQGGRHPADHRVQGVRGVLPPQRAPRHCRPRVNRDADVRRAVPHIAR